jgi:hypothetical protein
MNEAAEQKLKQITNLLAQKEDIDRQLEMLLVGAPEIEKDQEPAKRSPQAKTGGRKCSNCGKPGHIARKCPQSLDTATAGKPEERDDERDEDIEPTVGKAKPMTRSQCAGSRLGKVSALVRRLEHLG